MQAIAARPAAGAARTPPRKAAIRRSAPPPRRPAPPGTRAGLRTRLYYGLLASAALVGGFALAAYADPPEPPTDSELAEIVRIQQARIESLEQRLDAQSRLIAESLAAGELDGLRGGALPGTGLARMTTDGQSVVFLTQLETGDVRLSERPEPAPPRPWPERTPPPPAPAQVASLPQPQQAVPPAPAPAAAPAEPDEDERPAPTPEEAALLGTGPDAPERAFVEHPEDLLLLERGAILLPAGTLQLEASFDYTRYSGPRVVLSGLTLFEAIHIGLIRVEQLDRDVLTMAATARYGITDRIQADVRVPFVYRRDSELRGIGTGEERERSTSFAGLGDISARLSYQPVIGDGIVPDVIVHGEVQFPTGKDPFSIERVEVDPGVFRLARPPTGSGFYEFGGGGMLAWRVDPVVFFTGSTYTHRPARNLGDPFGRIEPGDSIKLFAGVNMRLTDRFGLNLSFVDQITMATARSGRKQPGTRSNDGRFIVGTSFALDPRWTLLSSAGIGLTNDAPDFQFTMSLSHTMQLGR